MQNINDITHLYCRYKREETAALVLCNIITSKHTLYLQYSNDLTNLDCGYKREETAALVLCNIITLKHTLYLQYSNDLTNLDCRYKSEETAHNNDEFRSQVLCNGPAFSTYTYSRFLEHNY